MKTIFITVFDGAASKNILRTDVFRVLKQHYRIVLFVPPQKLEFYREQFGESGVDFELSPPATYPTFERRYHVVALDSLHTDTVNIKIRHDYAKRGNFPKMIFKFLLWQIGRFKTYHRLMRFLYARVPDHSFDMFFEKYKPVGVFVPNMISNEDFRLVKAAKRRGLKVIGMPKSWDNFTGKTFFNTFPDFVMVQNQVMYEQAQQLFQYPKERMTIVGFPPFDVYERKEELRPRSEFLQKLGLDPAKKTILYGAAGHQIGPNDEEVLNILIRGIDADPELRKTVQILVRPHPKYIFQENKMEKRPFVIVDYPGRDITEKKSSWEFDDDDIAHLTNSIRHADVLITTMSTLNLEGAIFDRPLISIGFDGDKKIPYALSTARYYKYEQTQPLVKSGGMPVAYSAEELLSLVRGYLANPSKDAEGRKRIIERMVGTVGGRGKRVAEIVVEKIGV